jgi:cytochrome c2
MTKKSRNSVIPFLVIPCLLLADPAELRSSPENPAKGKQIFESMCLACHTIGGGTKVGPDLKNITGLRSTTWLTDFISNPDKKIKSGDPVANQLLKEFHGVEMPSLGLSGEQVSDVLAYLQSTGTMAKAQAAAPSAQAPLPSVQPPAPPAPAPMPEAPGPPAAALTTGSVEMGQQLFSGSVAFQKGGPPCLSCHDVASIPFPGGGTLGPDLTGAFAKFGAEKMNSILATLPFPTMRPLFDQRPLTAQEQQDLEAFLQKAGVQSLVGRGVQIGLAAIGGFIILVILAWIIRQDRLVTVPKAPVKSARRD